MSAADSLGPMFAKAQNISKKRPLSDKYSIEIQKHEGTTRVQAYYQRDPKWSPEPVGNIWWDDKTGKVSGWGTHPEHRQHLVPHLMVAAKDAAQNLGIAEPSHGGTYTQDSQRLLRRQAPDVLPEKYSNGDRVL